MRDQKADGASIVHQVWIAARPVPVLPLVAHNYMPIPASLRDPDLPCLHKTPFWSMTARRKRSCALRALLCTAFVAPGYYGA